MKDFRETCLNKGSISFPRNEGVTYLGRFMSDLDAEHSLSVRETTVMTTVVLPKGGPVKVMSGD